MTALLTFALGRQICTLNSFIGEENRSSSLKPSLDKRVSRNSLIGGYFKHSHIQQAEYLFDQMPHRDVIFWNTNALRVAQRQQARKVYRCFLDMNRCGEMRPMSSLSRGLGRVFDEILDKDVMLWNVLILGYMKFGCAKNAMHEFERMLKSGVRSGGIARIMWLALMSRARRDCSK
uniref:Pentatricopeptide repeat-containing protein n=1 Tax=Solanum lycopersicum TaxID=4081 RepID=A0A3Q7GNM7_SOLLC